MIEYAVVYLKVQHIVLCGHTSCGGAAAALGEARVGGVLDTWLTPLKTLRKNNEADLKAISDEGKRGVRLAELNVESGVSTLMSNYVVEEAVRERGLQVHGCIYDVGSGKIRDLGVGNAKSAKGGVDGSAADGEIVQGNHGMLVFRDSGAAMSVR